MVLAISRRSTLALFVLLAGGLGAYVWAGDRGSGKWSCERRTSSSSGGGDDEGGDEGGGQQARQELPPNPGEDPNYEGPSPNAPWREGEFAQKAGRASNRPEPVQEEPAGTREAMERALKRAHGKIAYLPASLDGVPDESWQTLLGERFMPITTQQIDQAGTAIEGPAWSLRGRGADFLLVDTRGPQPPPWLDAQATSLRSRLRDALPMSHFHPVVRGATHTLYRIGSPVLVTQPQASKLIAYVRAGLAGERASWPRVNPSTLGVDGDKHRVAITLRSFSDRKLGRGKLGWRTGVGDTLQAAVDQAISRVRKNWKVMREKSSLGAELSGALDEIELELEIFRDVCEITDREPRRLMWNLELGYEGAFLVEDDSMHIRLPADALQGGVETEAGFVERLEKNAHVDPGAWRNHDNRFGRFATLDFAEVKPAGRVVPMYRGNPLVRVSEVTHERLKRALTLGARWLWYNQLPDGQFRYRYKPLRSAADRWVDGNNVVRHALNPYTLMLVHKIAPDRRLVASARRGLEYTFAHLKHTGSRCYVWHTDVPAKTENAKMGTVSVTILSLIAMGDSMDISEYQDELLCLGEELLYMQDRNGHFRQYDVPRDHSYYGSENTIFPGEMMFALARLYTKTGDHKFKDAFDRALDWYKQWWAYRSARRTEDGIYTEKNRQDLVGYVPWALMALDAMHRKSPEQLYVDFAFELQDWMDTLFLFDPNTTPYPDYLGAYFKRHDELPAINGCGYTEGAASAFAIAKRVGRDVERRRRALVLGARFALQLQYTWRGNMFWIPDPPTALGGFRFHLTATRLRNDYSYHAMSALAQAALFLDESDYPARTPIALPEALREIR